jgi:hypothetical protein
MFLPEGWLISNELEGVISQKTELFNMNSKIRELFLNNQILYRKY